MAASIALWRLPSAVDRLALRVEGARLAVDSLSGLVPLALAVLLFAKTALQLLLHLVGFKAFMLDDFTRAMKADYWLRHDTFDIIVDGWFDLGKFIWLPMPDYIFGLGLAVYRDLYITPKVINLIISGMTLIAVYLLSKDLVGKAAGLLSAAFFAFSPWAVWLGVSGMTSDLLSILLIVLAILFLFRWFERDQPSQAVAAAACLFAANGGRFENWLVSTVFGLVFVVTAAHRWRQQRLDSRAILLLALAILLTAAFPAIWMVSCYLESGIWLQAIDNEHFTHDAPQLFAIHHLLLGFFPLELLFSIAGMVLFVKMDKRPAARLVLFVSLASFLFFIGVLRGEVSRAGAPARYFLPYIILLLPFASVFFLQIPKVLPKTLHNYAVVACTLVVLVMLIFNIVRSFNYRIGTPDDAFFTGLTLRNLEELLVLPENSRILLEREEVKKQWDFVAIVGTANKPERFTLIATAELIRLCSEEPAEACRDYVSRRQFDVVVTASPNVAVNLQRWGQVSQSWQMGRYFILAL
jgi:hypothetical protein